MGVTRDAAPSHGWVVVLSTLGALLIAAFIVSAAVTAVPPAAANLSSAVSDGSPIALESDTARGAIAVPAGWVVHRDGDARLVARTPDGGLLARVAIVRADADAFVEEHADRSGPLRRETLASGLPVVHADAADGGVVAAVILPGGALVTLTSEITSEAERSDAAYRPALAQLLDGVRS